VRLTARADMREKGLLSAIFPGLIQESKGHFILTVLWMALGQPQRFTEQCGSIRQVPICRPRVFNLAT